ncbi:MAG: prephenate dehydratase, partial [Clostridia bacterium]|nr:prephenate dehydratase [Clostridia bacterium]
DWKGVFNAIEKGMTRYGILPIENSSAGSVNGVYDLILQNKFYIVRTRRMHIRHSLLAKKGTSLQNVREIFSHEQALSQCGEFLKKFPNAKATVVENTAIAARMVAESERTDVAAISSPECAEIYGLSSLASNIQNVDNNFTRFICISKKAEVYPASDRISLVMRLPHVTGSLNKILSKFSSMGLNLTKIESRPIATSEFEFAFYFDFEGDVRKKEVLNLLSDLSSSVDSFAFLGCYKETQ